MLFFIFGFLGWVSWPSFANGSQSTRRVISREKACNFARFVYLIRDLVCLVAKMAKLVDIYNSEKEPVMKRRQLPLNIYDNLTVSLHFDITTNVDYSLKSSVLLPVQANHHLITS